MHIGLLTYTHVHTYLLPQITHIHHVIYKLLFDEV